MAVTHSDSPLKSTALHSTTHRTKNCHYEEQTKQELACVQHNVIIPFHLPEILKRDFPRSKPEVRLKNLYNITCGLIRLGKKGHWQLIIQQ